MYTLAHGAIADGEFGLQGSVIVTLGAPERLTFNVTLNKPFSAADQLQSILISKPAFINSTAATLATLVGGNATNTQVVSACTMHHPPPPSPQAMQAARDGEIAAPGLQEDCKGQYESMLVG